MAENKTVDKEKYLDEIEDSIRTICVLTSGGDAPGMNAAIRAVADGEPDAKCHAAK